jgi:hypothetical protein
MKPIYSFTACSEGLCQRMKLSKMWNGTAVSTSSIGTSSGAKIGTMIISSRDTVAPRPLGHAPPVMAETESAGNNYRSVVGARVHRATLLHRPGRGGDVIASGAAVSATLRCGTSQPHKCQALIVRHSACVAHPERRTDGRTSRWCQAVAATP